MSQEEGGAEQSGKGGEGGEAALPSDASPSELPPPEEQLSASKPAQPRKEESPFSFKHFLKRDLSLPTTSTSYESTGAKPKIYSNTVHPSPAKTSQSSSSQDYRKDGKLGTRENWAGPGNASSDSTIEMIMNPGSNSEPKDNYFHMDHCDVSSFRRSPLGIPSLPDFVQDHLLLEQTYLGSNGPLTVDFDNLPDFTLNSNYDNAQCSTNASSGSGARRIASCKSVPLDLPSFIEERAECNERAEGRCRPSPLDLPNNLSLDLTDSLNHLNLKRRDNQSRIPFPLDLPGNDNSTSGGGESSRLPDFLPSQSGASNIGSSGSNRDDLAEERRLRMAAERELRAALQTAASLRRELQAARTAEQNARRELLETRAASTRLARELRGAGRTGGSGGSSAAAVASAPSLSSPLLVEEDDRFTTKQSSSDENNAGRLKSQITHLRNELSVAQREIEDLHGSRRDAARSLNLATNTAENSLRELLNGLDQLRGLASSLDPP